jgi:hypothetical protein
MLKRNIYIYGGKKDEKELDDLFVVYCLVFFQF